jgi:hypothetical protein
MFESKRENYIFFDTPIRENSFFNIYTYLGEIDRFRQRDVRRETQNS